MILITGAGGRVGRILERQLEARFPDRLVAATREEMDLTDQARLVLEMERLDSAMSLRSRFLRVVPGGSPGLGRRR